MLEQVPVLPRRDPGMIVPARCRRWVLYLNAATG